MTRPFTTDEHGTRLLKIGRPDLEVDPKNVHPTDAFYTILEGGE